MLFFFGGGAETRDGPSPGSLRSVIGTTGVYHRHDSQQASARPVSGLSTPAGGPLLSRRRPAWRQEEMVVLCGKCLPDSNHRTG